MKAGENRIEREINKERRLEGMKLEIWVFMVRTMTIENPQRQMLSVAMKKTPSSMGLNTSSIACM